MATNRQPSVKRTLEARLLLVSGTAMLCLTIPCSVVFAQAHDAVPLACTAESNADVKTARATLEANPVDLDARFRFADALLAASCYDAAVHALEEGEQVHPRSSELQNRLRTTRSLQTEQSYFAGLEQAGIAARIQRNQLRCTRLNDVTACDEWLRMQPENTDALTAKGDALLKSNRPADATLLYRRAAAVGNVAGIQSKLDAADAQRKALLVDCESSTGASALQACRGALLPSAADEFFIHKRRGILLQAANQPADALNEFIAASNIKREDRSVALAIIALTANNQRKDAAALSALGAAHLALGNPTNALAPLRQAQSLAPGIPEIRTRLATAERLAKAESSRAIPATMRATPALPARVTPPTAVAAKPRVYSNAEPASRSH